MPGADAPGRPRLRELRHDFRAYYHCRYDDVDPDEAVDLIATLPQGSLYRASLDPHLAWSDERHDLADIKDLIVMSMHLSATGSTVSATVGFVTAVVLAYVDGNLFRVAIGACVMVYLAEFFCI